MASQEKRLNEKYDTNCPDHKTAKPESSAVYQYGNRSDRNRNLEHRYAGRQSLMRMKMALGTLLQLLCFFLNLLLVSIVLGHLGFIGIRRRLAESGEYIDLGRRLGVTMVSRQRISAQEEQDAQR
jgi:hypothetical protein